MTTPVTAAMLYDLVACPHRVTMDLFADPGQRDQPNPFVELLWEKGSLYEREVIATLEVPFLDLSPYAGDEKERLTLEAMQRSEALIYGGRIQADGLLGDPDLLRKDGAAYTSFGPSVCMALHCRQRLPARPRHDVDVTWPLT